MPTRADLFTDLDVECTPDAPIGPLTWYGVGGRADMLVSPNSIEALADLLRRCRMNETAVRVLGGGANLLVADDGVDGIVLRLDRPCFTAVDYNRRGSVTAARVGGGVDLFGLIHALAHSALAGFEHMAGIPGTLGGAIRMNAGGTPGDVAQTLESVELLAFDGKLRTFTATELAFRYRGSDLPAGIVTNAVLELHEDDPVKVRQRVLRFFSMKKAAQPMADHSAGCAFRNPVDPESNERVSAGKIIDTVGLKGVSCGGAQVSTQHANFITVDPQGTASDVQTLMQLVQERVQHDTGMRLEREVVVWSRGGAS